MKHVTIKTSFGAFLILLSLLLSGCSNTLPTELNPNSTNQDIYNESFDERDTESASEQGVEDQNGSEPCPDSPDEENVESDRFTLSEVPEYSGEPYYIVNEGEPFFSEADLTTDTFIQLGELDELGRCTPAFACLGVETMPEEGEERGEIGNVKPSGWNQEKYPCVAGLYCVNRAHMIGWLLSGLNDDERNLITGTRYLNLEMLPFEEMVARYIEQTGNHVLYRATPIFKDSERMCRGLLLEAMSVEDNGKEICFNLYFFNVQPGLEFSYADGSSSYTGVFLDTDSVAVDYDHMLDDPKESEAPDSSDTPDSEKQNYVLNTNTHKFHLPDCSSAETISEKNKDERYTTMEDLISDGYDPCKRCIDN